MNCGKCGAGAGNLDGTDPVYGLRCFLCGWSSEIEAIKAVALTRPKAINRTELLGNPHGRPLGKKPRHRKPRLSAASLKPKWTPWRQYRQPKPEGVHG